MVVAVRCPAPKCLKYQLVEEHDRGTIVPCLICRAGIKVPSPDGTMPESPKPPPPRPKAPAPKPPAAAPVVLAPSDDVFLLPEPIEMPSKEEPFLLTEDPPPAVEPLQLDPNQPFDIPTAKFAPPAKPPNRP